MASSSPQLKHSHSLPSLPSVPSIGSSNSSSRALKRSPLSEVQNLCTCEVYKRRIVTEAVGGHGHHHEAKRMVFMAFERGVEWERANIRAQVPKEPLPPLSDVLRAIAKMDLPSPRSQRDRELSTDSHGRHKVHFAGFGAVRLGPRLPIRRPRLESLSGPPPEPHPQEKKGHVPAASSGSTSPQPPRRAQKGAVANSLGHARSSLKVDTSRRASQRANVSFAMRKEEDGAHNDSEVSSPKVRKSITLRRASQDQTIDGDVRTTSLPFPWTEDELYRVFNRFDTDHDGEVHKDDLLPALRYLGARNAPADAMRIAAALTQYATLSFDEFSEYVHKFREFDVQLMRQEFEAADKDHSGFLDVEEVHALLHERGFAPTAQSTLEAVQEVTKSDRGTISFRQFDRLREYLRRTEGLLKADVEEIRAIFQKTTQGHTGQKQESTRAEQVWRVTTYFGYSAQLDEIRKLVVQICKEEGTDELTFYELLKLIRCVRDRETANIVSVLENRGANPTKLPLEELGIALQDLGYFVADQTVWEILDSLGALTNEGYLTLEELTNFLRRYRVTEGFTQAERDELTEVFHRESRDRGALRTLELARVLRWFGFPRDLQQVQALVQWIDFDGSGELELGEFLKLMRRLFQDESRNRQGAFDMLQNDLTKEVAASSLPAAVMMLQGVEAKAEFVKGALEKVAIEMAARRSFSPNTSPKPRSHRFTSGGMETPKFLNKAQFEAFFRHYRAFTLQEFHKSAGYSPAEVERLRATFAIYDGNNSGTVERGELVLLLSEFFPEATKSKAAQREIQRALQEVDEDGNYQLNFKEFLQLMRKCDDMRDERDLRMEMECVRDCGMTTEEVEGFRQIFMAHADWKGELSVDALVDLLSRVGELSDDAPVDLAQIIREAHPDGREVARFPQFLRLVKKVTDDNYGRINDFAARLVKRDMVRQQRTAVR